MGFLPFFSSETEMGFFSNLLWSERFVEFTSVLFGQPCFVDVLKFSNLSFCTRLNLLLQRPMLPQLQEHHLHKRLLLYLNRELSVSPIFVLEHIISLSYCVIHTFVGYLQVHSLQLLLQLQLL